MKMHRPELADVVRTHEAKLLARWNHVLSREQKKALRDIRDCRSAALGGRLQQCDRCGHRVILYNSCRNRHCPKCQAQARARWLEQREAELLPVPYFHVVFTIPASLGPLALQNPKLIYNTLFRAAASTLLETASDPRHLGASIGFLAVLHTWGQNLHLHPHLHCIVPGGNLLRRFTLRLLPEIHRSSCPSVYSAGASENVSCALCDELSARAHSVFRANSNLCRNPPPSGPCAIKSQPKIGCFV